ncbi:MAG: nucleotide sugar dehydrogenase [Candidatus Omnitrophota bacterium]
MNTHAALKQKIKNKTATVGVIGLGYVGLPMAVQFARKGFDVRGIDLSAKRIARLKKGVSYIGDISDAAIKEALTSKKFTVTSDAKHLKKCDVVIVCVPTPINKALKPDISYILSAAKVMKENIRPGQLFVLESTTYPGTTREVLLPILSGKKLTAGNDFFLAFSPERIDPGNPKYDFSNIPKLVGGITGKCTELAKLLYRQVTEKVIGLSSPETAEVTKLLENSFRIVNIGLINEFANLCHKLDIDVWEVIEAAKTKPFGYMPFYPGPGVGGHCIPADPMYLSWKARKVGFETRMIDLAAKVNINAPRHIVERISAILKKYGKKIKNSKILILGAAYKKNINDLRESPALDVMKALDNKKAKWAYSDAYIPYLDIHGLKSKSVKLSPNLVKKQDLVVILTDHSNVDYKMVAKNSKRIFDTRNITGRSGIKGDNIVKL